MVALPRILLVNSIDQDRQELSQLLSSLGGTVTEACSGLDAVDALQKDNFDLVVTAIAIGPFDCWRLARFIRSGICQGGRTLPIIIVTRIWCERITEITARDFGINHLLSFDERDRLPGVAKSCLETTPTGMARVRVLVVEDHADNAELVKKILRSRYDIELAEDGEIGIKAWQERQHDLVLLDIMLPKKSGGEVLKEIMAIKPDQPVVMMTAHGSMDLAKQMLLEGAADFVTKPFRAEELRRVCELATRREDYLVCTKQVDERMASLRQLRNLLQNIIDSMPSVLIGVDQNGQVTLWNHQAEEITGVAQVDAQGQALTDIWPDFKHIDEVTAALQNGEILKLSKVYQRRGEKSSYLDITIYPLLEGSAVGAVVRLDDVTDRVMLEERIMQSEKMVSVGRLAAGMAHEINNPLAGVLQNLQVVKQRLVDDSKANLDAADAAGLEMESLAEYLQRRDIGARLEAVMDAGKRTADLVDNMINFTQRDNSSMAMNDLTDLIDKSVDLAAGNFSLKRKFDFRAIKILREYDRRLPLIECNPMQIQQVIFNLLLNGAYSMEEKLQQSRVGNGHEGYRPQFVLRIKHIDQFVRVEIEDNGVGMDEEMTNRLFEPFFTTKKVGEGTGLGLSICYFIVTESHQGNMSVESNLDQGSRFVLELPLSQK